MRKIRTWQLCRTGSFGSDGATITEQDLKELLETFTPPRPISLGHDMAQGDSFPKFGDVLALDGIYSDPKHPGEKVLVGNVRLHAALDEQFDDGDGAGTYNGWSVTIPRRASDGKRYLHSLAVLGATPPKIPGLDQLNIKTVYSDGDQVQTFTFSEKLNYQEETMTEAEKQKMEALEKANKELEEKLKTAEKKSAEKEPAKKEEQFAEPKTDDAIKARLEATEKELRQNKLERFSDAVSNKVPQGILEKAKAVAGALVDIPDVNFSDNGTTQSSSALKLFQDVLSAWPQATEESQLYNFADGNNGQSEPKENNWAKMASKL